MVDSSHRLNASQPKVSFFRANPVLSKMSKITERSEADCATYTGIAVKTLYFLVATLIGIFGYLLVRSPLLTEGTKMTMTFGKNFTVLVYQKELLVMAGVLVVGLIAELVGVFVPKTIPVSGTIYSMTQGCFISFLVFTVLDALGYAYLGMEALLLTVAVVAVMSWLYTSGKLRMTKKFTMVLLILMLSSMILAVLTFVLSLIPATRPMVQSMQQNFGFTVVVDLLGIVIASLFLISDFTMIDTCVQDNYPKKYEWTAAFGLVFTVIWLYLKILDLLIRIAGNRSKS